MSWGIFSVTRFLFELLFLVVWWVGIGKKKKGRRKKRKLSKRARRKQMERLKKLAVLLVVIFVVIPYGVGFFVPFLRYFPSFLEAQKLRLTYGTLEMLRVKAFGPPDLSQLIQKESASHGVERKLVEAVVEVESSRRQFVVSRTGAMGLMQVMPGTFYSVESWNPFSAQTNISAGTAYLASLLRRFDGNTRLAVAAYNAGPTVVDGCRCVPQNGETPEYVRKVLGLYSAK